MTRVSILFFLSFCFSVFCQAQIKVSGIVKDQSTAETLPYTSVVIYSTADKLIKGTASAQDGSFELELKPGTYKLQIKFLSYEDYTKTIAVSNQNLNLGVLALKPSSTMLNALELVEEKNQMQLKIDKREFNVGKDLTTKGGTAAQVLDNIPSVEVDIDGNVSLRGSENVRILIDGKPSSLMGINASNVFDMIPAESIDKVEVITNPSARYEASGEVGIINIVLKKDKVKGLNGVVMTRLGTPEAYGGGVQMNYRKNKLNLFAGLSYDYRSNKGSGYFETNVQNADTTYFYESRDEDLRTGTSTVFRLGSDYQFNKQHSLGVSTLFQLGTGDDQNIYKYSDFNGSRVLFNQSTRQLNDLEDSKGYDLNLNYNFKSKKEGEILVFQAQASSNIDDEGGTISESYQFNNQQTKEQRTDNDEKNNRILLQLDYIRPLKGKSKLETGLRYSSQDLDVNYKVEQQDTTDESWFILENYHNSLNYKEQISAAYMMYSNEMDSLPLSYQVGLRYEHSDVEANYLMTNETYPRTFDGWFPTLHLSYKVDDERSYQLSYSKRVNRPQRWHLVPFFSFSSERTIFAGNPYLNPSYTHSYEFSKLNYWKKGSFLASVYYRHSTDVIDRILQAETSTVNSVIPFNIGTSDDYGLELTGSYRPDKKLKLRASFNLYHQNIDGEYGGQNLDANYVSWNTRWSVQYILPKDIIFQTSFNYRAKTQDTQGEVKPRYAWDMGFSKDVLKKKGTLSLSIRDVLNTRKRRATTTSPGVESTYEFQWNSRSLSLSFAYRINQKKTKLNSGEQPANFGGGGQG